MTRYSACSPLRPLAAAVWAVVAVLVVACKPTAETADGNRTASPHAGAVDARMAGELERASERGNVCSAREAKAAGLTAEYFAATNFVGPPLLTRQEGPIDMPWPEVGQELKSPARSARWRGWVRPPFTGKFSFHTDIPGAQISVAGKRLTAQDGQVELNAGRYHPIQIELRELSVKAKGAGESRPPLKLSWTTPFGARYLLPKAVLFPPSDTVDSASATPKAAAQAAGS